MKLILTYAYIPIRHNFKIDIISYNTSLAFFALARPDHMDTYIPILIYASQITTILITLFFFEKIAYLTLPSHLYGIHWLIYL